MSFLSGDQFAGKSSQQPEVPSQLRTSVVLLWVQAGLGVLAGIFVIVTTWQIQSLTDDELAKQSKGQLTHDQVPYFPIFSYGVGLVALAVALVWCARGLKSGRRAVRIVVYVAEIAIIPTSFFNMSIYTQPQLACIFILPALAVIIMMSMRPVRQWYAGLAGASPETPAACHWRPENGRLS